MKTSTFFFAFLMLLSIQVSATVFTVNNTPGSNAQFDNIQAAHDAASPGDTILVGGSATQYNLVSVSKKIVIIGPGFKPNNNDNLVANISFVSLASSNAEGSVFIGFKSNGITNGTAPLIDVDFIYIFGCELGSIDGRLRAKNWTIENTISGAIDGLENSTLRNSFPGVVRNLKTSGIISCVFFTGSSNGENLLFSNNIFFNSNQISTNNSTFNNNLFTRQDPVVTSPNLPVSNSFSNNLFGTDPKFVNTAFSTGFSFQNDYNLQPDSPAIGAGTDGRDLGVYGGQGFSNTGEPPLPIVTDLLIKNSTLDQNGQLQVEIKGRANN